MCPDNRQSCAGQQHSQARGVADRPAGQVTAQIAGGGLALRDTRRNAESLAEQAGQSQVPDVFSDSAWLVQKQKNNIKINKMQAWLAIGRGGLVAGTVVALSCVDQRMARVKQ